MHAIPPYLIVPLLLGLLYSIAAMAYKRAMQEGMDIWRIIFFSNLTTAILLLPLLLVATLPLPQASFYQPLLASLAFFTGITLNVLALQSGDVSIATPLLGTKVLFVALFTTVVLSEPVQATLWLAAVLVVVSLWILRGPGRNLIGRFWPTVLLALSSSASFALCDVFFQAWARIWGIGIFIPSVFTMVCALSCGLRIRFPQRTGALSGKGLKWLIAGCILNGLQTLGMFICVSLFEHPNAATAINVVYNSRVIWSVALVWAVGQWFGNIEREQGLKVMMGRLAGSMLLLGAIVLALLGP
jgi:drug/metabolite transporter (DMT)-like permease